jgi:imidazoleglycerol-phosphate dehydratase
MNASQDLTRKASARSRNGKAHKERPQRKATYVRKTKETDISVSLNLDGEGCYDIQTGIHFLNHMLELFAKHSRIDLQLSCKGDLHVDDHHSVEDVAIALGHALAEALGDKVGIERYGYAFVPMDETLARAVVDLSGRSYLVFRAQFSRAKISDMATEMVEHFSSRWQNISKLHPSGNPLRQKHASQNRSTLQSLCRGTAPCCEVSSDHIASTKGTLT